jgi:hypothetical protein
LRHIHTGNKAQTAADPEEDGENGNKVLQEFYIGRGLLDFFQDIWTIGLQPPLRLLLR